MASRKPLQEKDKNRRSTTHAQISNHSINCLSRSSDALKRFQLPLHHNNSYNVATKKPTIQQSLPRISRLNRSRPTNLDSIEVISTISKNKEQQKRQKHQKQREQMQQEELQELEQQPPEHMLNQRSTMDELSTLDNHTPPPEPPQQTDSSTEYEQDDYTETSDTDCTSFSLKRRHHEFYDDAPTTNADTEPDLQPFTLTSPSTSASSSSSSPSKRQHCLETDDSQARTGIDVQQNLQPLVIPFDLSTILPTSMSSSSRSHQNDYLETHHQTRPDTDAQQNLQSPITPFDLSTIFLTNAPPSSTSNQDDHLDTHHQTLPDMENQPNLQPLMTPFQLYTHSSALATSYTDTAGHDTISNTLPPPHHDHTKDNQQAVMTSRSMILPPPWVNRYGNLSEDLPLSLSPHTYQPLLLPLPPRIYPPSPVYKLNDDCLTEILKWCAITETLWEVSLVCKHWRNVALQPYVWRAINYTWIDFVKHLKTMSLPKCGRGAKSSNINTSDPLTSLPFVHIRTITLNNIHNSIVRLHETPTSSIFTNLGTLRLSNIQFKDILDLIAWTKQLNELDCKDIMTDDSNDMVMITPFSVLQKLHTLKLHFASMCELIGPTSLSSAIDLSSSNRSRNSNRNRSTITNHSINNRWRLSPKLCVLKIVNTYDIEEFLTSNNNYAMARASLSSGPERMEEWIQSWDTMENTLMHKYRVLMTLRKLTKLSLGHCTGYTARIWRECVAPATKHLTHLTLCGWNGDGNREAPLAWKERLEMALTTNTPVDLHMEDVERALAEMLAGLHHLRSLTLLHFKCTSGVIRGLERLTETTGNILSWGSLEATLNDPNGDILVPTRSISDMACTSSLNDLLNWYLVTARIKICDGSSVLRKK